MITVSGPMALTVFFSRLRSELKEQIPAMFLDSLSLREFSPPTGRFPLCLPPQLLAQLLGLGILGPLHRLLGLFR